MTNDKITTSYGHGVHGFMVGAGYGKNPDLSAEADRLAEMLVKHFGKPVEKRGNSDGQSCGAFHDKPREEGRIWGDTVYGLSAVLREGQIKYAALLREPLDLHREFDTPDKALWWLSTAMRSKGKRGGPICEKCGGDTACVLDGEAWCPKCQRYQ